MKNLHVSQLTQFNLCPYKYKYDDSPIPPSNTYKGDVLNVGATSTGDLEPYAKHYSMFTDNFKQLQRHTEVFHKARKYVHALRERHPQFYQEAKHIIRYEHEGDEEVFVTGSPDLHYYDEEDGIRTVEDLKFSTHGRYSKPDKLAKDCQRIIYPLMIMRYMDVDLCRFRFTVWDKKSGKRKYCGEVIVKRKEAEDFFNDIVGRYMATVHKGEWEAKECGLCYFCPLQKAGCPVWNVGDDFVDDFDFADEFTNDDDFDF